MSPTELPARLKERWGSLNQTQKIISAIVILGVIASLFSLGRLVMRPAYAPLFTGLESKEAGIIADNLKTMKVPYEISDQGKTIMVPESQVYEVRNQLAGSGALGSSSIGFELFDQSKFGQTDFEQQVGYQRALQGELSRTVAQLDGVEQARVHLVLPEKSVFISEQGTPSASVALKLEQGKLLKPEQIQGICDLFVGSVSGLEPDNVHIIDTEGNILSDNFESNDPGAVITRAALDQMHAKREYEKELEKRVQQMLAKIVGQGNAVAMVTADLDFDQRQTNSTIASNPDDLKVSEYNATESGTGIGGGGVVGTDSNVTTTPFVQNTGSSNYTKEESTINYQVSTREESVIDAPGSVRRLSASVVVNDVAAPFYVQEIQEVVGAAIGYNQDRGDQILVTSMAFDDSYLKKVEAEMAHLEDLAQKELLYKYAIAGGALLVVLLAALVALFLWRRRRVYDDVEGEIVTTIPVQDMELELDQEQKLKADKQQRLIDQYKETPDKIAEIIKVWIRD